MSNFTFDEINLMCIYNTGTRAGLMQALTDMRGQLEPDEAELLELTDSALRKLDGITDEQFAELELVPDFDGTAKAERRFHSEPSLCWLYRCCSEPKGKCKDSGSKILDIFSHLSKSPCVRT